jgi:hypothetical protein
MKLDCVILLACVASVSACSPAAPADLVICGGSGTNFGIDVVDATLHPVSGLAISDSVPSDGSVFVIAHAEERPGHYIIMSTWLPNDSLGYLSGPLIVRGTGANGRFSASYNFGPINRCEYGKIAGPDTVVAQ